jgi:hypothetical protein
MFILGEMVAGHSHCHVWLVARICWVLSMDFLSYGRSFFCAQELASCAQVRLFAFLLPLWGWSYRVSMAASGFCKHFCKVADLKFI